MNAVDRVVEAYTRTYKYEQRALVHREISKAVQEFMDGVPAHLVTVDR